MNKTPLTQIHHDLGAKMIDFGGWEMPVQYSGIISEHRAVRNQCGIFDVSHMGEIIIRGEKATSFVQKLIANNAARLQTGGILYTPMCYPDGGIVDDILVYRTGDKDYLLVVNAANTDKDWQWIQKNRIKGVETINVSDDYAQLALQGPASRDILQQLTEINLADLVYYNFKEGKVAGTKALLSRTGYTGELGYEIYLSPEDAVNLWESLFSTGEDYGLVPAGLGARDTLRLEKKYCLYGNDINEETNPLEAGLGWTVDLTKEDFFGKERLLKIREEGLTRILAGFKVTGRGIPRHGYKITAAGKEVGEVTSGSFSPTLEENIGLGYIKKELAEPNQKLSILIRGREIDAEVVKTPFV